VLPAAEPTDDTAPRPVDHARRRGTRDTLWRIARWAIGLALVAGLFHQVDLGEAARHLVHADHTGVLLALLMLALSRFVKAARSYPLMRVQTNELSFWVCLRAYLASGSAAYLLPSGFGADVLRAVALGRGRGLVPEVTASIAMERMLSGVALVTANLLAALYALQGRQPGRFALGSLGLAALGVVAMLFPLNATVRDWIRRSWIGRRLARHAGSRWMRTIARFWDGYYAYRHQPGVLVLVLLLSLAETVLVVFSLSFLAAATGTHITLAMLLIVVPLTLVLHRLPITYWGIGVADGGFAFLLKALYFVPPTHALTVAAAYRVIELLANIPGALLWRDLAGAGRKTAPPAPREAGREARVPVGVGG
jgi:glycosyltransferase 2 family protein